MPLAAPGGGDHVAVVDEEHVGVDLDLRVALGEDMGAGPVRGGTSTVQQAGCGEIAGAAGADRGDPDALAVRLAQQVERIVGHSYDYDRVRLERRPQGVWGRVAVHLDLADPADGQVTAVAAHAYVVERRPEQLAP